MLKNLASVRFEHSMCVVDHSWRTADRQQRKLIKINLQLNVF